jgi:protease IV
VKAHRRRRSSPVLGITRTVALAVGMMAASAAGPASAQQPRAEVRGATDGVGRVYRDYSGEGDASSLELNPALLSATKGLDLTLLGYGAVSDFARGTGFGAFTSLNLRFGLALGFGAQFVRPRLGQDVSDFAEDENPDITKLSWALSSGMGEFGAFGLAVHGVRAGGVWLQRPSLDLGMLTRVFNYGSVGVVAQFSPADIQSQILPSHLRLIGEAAVRPLGTHWLELAGGVTYRVLEADPGEARSRVGARGVLPRGRIAVRYQGLAIKGEVEQVQTVVLDPMTLTPLRGQKAVQGSVALEASWDFVSVEGGVSAGISDGVDAWGVKARLHTQRRGRVFWPRQVDAERIDMSTVGDERSLIALLERLERARRAGSRTILVIDARGTSAGWASLHEVREALIRVRDAGGHVFAYLEQATLRDYYLASVAETIYMHPAGGLAAFGIASRSLYFAEALDKIGVNAEVVKIGEYKSANERFTETAPTPPDRRQRVELLRDTYGQIVHDIARGRALTIATVRDHIDGSPHAPDDAVAAGLVDKVVFRDELTKEISDDIGARVEFRDIADTRPDDETWSKTPYIAVVLVEDAIIDGDTRRIPFFDLGFTGGDTIATTLRKVRGDPFCRGIVLRVNSPGGSALASDIIWREVQRTTDAHDKDSRSPAIVVSMGDVAASGGYYVSMGAKTVLADPMTVTGSIGVISLHLDVSGLLGRLGISSTTFKEGELADINSPFKPYSDEERARMERSIQQTYDLFRARVSEGRGLPMERVHELGQGRVYSGIAALDAGLIDRFGGLHDAVALLREEMGVASFRELELRVLPRARTLLDLILESVEDPFPGAVARTRAKRRNKESGAAQRAMLPLALDEALSRLPLSVLFLPQRKAHTLMPYTLELE